MAIALYNMKPHIDKYMYSYKNKDKKPFTEQTIILNL